MCLNSPEYSVRVPQVADGWYSLPTLMPSPGRGVALEADYAPLWQSDDGCPANLPPDCAAAAAQRVMVI